MEADFSGWATKAGLKCSDGRTINADAFKHMDGQKVPLVYQHIHNDPTNVLGHAILEARPEGVYAHCYFNGTDKAKTAKNLVEHGDITKMSIYANELVEKAKQVFHGTIREVSLVLSGANPGAVIENVNVRHGDYLDELDDEVIIHTGLDVEVKHDGTAAPKDTSKETWNDVYKTLDEKQVELVHFMIEKALEGDAAAHSDGDPKVEAKTTDGDPKDDGKTAEGTGEKSITHSKEGADDVNVFEQADKKKNSGQSNYTLTHADVQGIVKHAAKTGSLKLAINEFLEQGVKDGTLQHGITNIEVLFPDYQTISATPEWNKRRTEWVAGVLNGVSRRPFSKIKSIVADITQDEARAKGYITGNYKTEEWISVTSRTTGPTTVYKKQKLDRDDIVDITSFDVVAWLWGEIRLMLEEEIARAILIGDGRDPSDPDKIKDPMALASGDGIRSIRNEHELYMTTVNVNLDDSSSSYMEAIESILRARRFYQGTGRPTFYTTEQTLTEMLLLKDEAASNRRLYPTEADLAAALRVDSIVAVAPMETDPNLVGILVNLTDYIVGTDRGGEITQFDDFDIDYNQYKYLMETRLSGALGKIKSAQVVLKTAAANVLVVPTVPTFVKATGVVTIPTKTGVVYKNADTNATLTAGAQTALSVGATLNVLAVPAAGYYFATSEEDFWSFKRPAA